MKKYIILTGLFMLSSYFLFAQTQQYKIVFDITSKDTADQQTVVRHVNGMSKAYPDAKLEVVIYGGAISMVLKDKSVVADAIQGFAANKNVAFKICGGTMKRYKVEKGHLIPGVEIVPDAIIEIVTKQAEGWGYIKEAN